MKVETGARNKIKYYYYSYMYDFFSAHVFAFPILYLIY